MEYNMGGIGMEIAIILLTWTNTPPVKWMYGSLSRHWRIMLKNWNLINFQYTLLQLPPAHVLCPRLTLFVNEDLPMVLLKLMPLCIGSIQYVSGPQTEPLCSWTELLCSHFIWLPLCSKLCWHNPQTEGLKSLGQLSTWRWYIYCQHWNNYEDFLSRSGSLTYIDTCTYPPKDPPTHTHTQSHTYPHSPTTTHSHPPHPHTLGR